MIDIIVPFVFVFTVAFVPTYLVMQINRVQCLLFGHEYVQISFWFSDVNKKSHVWYKCTCCGKQKKEVLIE